LIGGFSLDKKRLLCSIPKVDEILRDKEIISLQESMPRTLVVEMIRNILEDTRKFILGGSEADLEGYEVDERKIIGLVTSEVRKAVSRHLRKVINGTGIIIHTNLGRSVLSPRAIEAVNEAASNYSNLEYDLDEGKRGSRYSHVEGIIKKITGAEATMVVNNNAAAVLLVLSTLCAGREAVVSRGELVEIGGSFRIPDIMEQSGARLVEVGTTNRTHLYDYERAINENTGILLKVHTSNYRILGFTESVGRSDLVHLASKCCVPAVEDIGSGSFVDLSKYGLEREPTVQEAISSGMDIVTFSGDKMLGGPQAGIIAGKRKYIDLMRKNPLTRALRIDKMTLAALEATCMEYIDEEQAVKNIPTLQMIAASKDELGKRAKRLSRILSRAAGEKAEIAVQEESSQVGGGAMPMEYLPTFVVSVKPHLISAGSLEIKLRGSSVPIVARTQKDRVLLDVRTLYTDDYPVIGDALHSILGGADL
jgi:L-seryl-tRNA(Ser) seleniumtransferase